MKQYKMPRGCGKSLRLCYISEFTGDPILVVDEESAQNIKNLAMQHCIGISDVITVNDIIHSNKKLNWHNGTNNIVIDDAVDVLIEIIKKLGCNIDAITEV